MFWAIPGRPRHPHGRPCAPQQQACAKGRGHDRRPTHRPDRAGNAGLAWLFRLVAADPSELLQTTRRLVVGASPRASTRWASRRSSGSATVSPCGACTKRCSESSRSSRRQLTRASSDRFEITDVISLRPTRPIKELRVRVGARHVTASDRRASAHPDVLALATLHAGSPRGVPSCLEGRHPSRRGGRPFWCPGRGWAQRRSDETRPGARVGPGLS